MGDRSHLRSDGAGVNRTAPDRPVVLKREPLDGGKPGSLLLWLSMNVTTARRQRIVLILCSVAALAGGCSTVDENAANRGYGYGVKKVQSDGYEGLSKLPERYEGRFAEMDRGNFVRGYNEGYEIGTQAAESGLPFSQPLVARAGLQVVALFAGSVLEATCKTVHPTVEETRFLDQQRQIVVRSRGTSGPATVQLFDCATGIERGRVTSDQIRDGQPAWAATMGG